jgi:crotonobetaine/carnitine-CoA ligase
MISALLAEQARNRPDAPLVVTDEGTLTYRGAAMAAQAMAARLADMGVGPGDHVALVAGNSAEWVAGFLGIQWLGAVAVTLNDRLRGEDMDYLLAQSDARLVITDPDWLGTAVPGLRPELQALPRIVLTGDQAFLSQQGHAQASAAISAPTGRKPGDACAILYTSGTTGRPKGVICTQAGHIAAGTHTARILELTPQDRIFVFLPLFHTNPQMYALMSALITGASLAVQPRFSAGSFFDDARRLGATGCSFVGTVLAILASRHLDQRRDHGLRFCIGGGTTAELAATVQARFGIHVHELYGMTEIGGWVSGASRAQTRLGANGLVRDDMEVAILGPDDAPRPAGETGEIAVRPRQPHVMMQGYYRKPDETLAALSNLWFHTGDIGRFDADGYLYFLGRKKELIRRGGEMISPAQIEERVLRVAGVQDCAVVGIADAIMGEEIKLAIVPTAEADPDRLVRVLNDHFAQTLADFMRPRYLEFLAEIPRTSTEKIRRDLLAVLGEGVIDLKPRPGGATAPPPSHGAAR